MGGAVSSIFGPEVTPVDLLPVEAFGQGMSLHQYAKLEHGRLHNARIREFRQIVARQRALSVERPKDPATREDIALLIAVMYGHHSSYGAVDDVKKAEAFAAALETMGGKL